MLAALLLFAEDQQQKGPTTLAEQLFNFLPFIALPLLLYFFLLRPSIRKDQEHRTLQKSLKKNDKVVTTAGIYGTVVAVSDTEDEVTVKVDDNVRLRMLKGSILRNLTNEEAAKAPKTAKEGGA